MAGDYVVSEIALKLGRIIRQLRVERGISQEGLAAISGIDRTFMGAIERGEASASIDVVQKVAFGLKISLSELMRLYESAEE